MLQEVAQRAIAGIVTFDEVSKLSKPEKKRLARVNLEFEEFELWSGCRVLCFPDCSEGTLYRSEPTLGLRDLAWLREWNVCRRGRSSERIQAE